MRPHALSLALALALAAPAAAADRDGAHDFDFNVGVWTTHIRRPVHPLSGSSEMIEMNGTVTVRPIWGGRGQIEEIEAEGPNGHWEGLTMFLYDPTAKQWNQTFAGSKVGVLTRPLIGSFKDGRGELYAQDTVDGKSILIRCVWSDITPDAHRFEESYSADGGKTWAPSFTAQLTRTDKAMPPPAFPPGQAADGAQDFDFDIGTWKTDSTRLLKPLTGSKEWVPLSGKTVVRPVWGGRGNLAEFAADGPSGHLELISLRLYDPAAKQWSLNFANPGGGTFSVPMIGSFRDGVGEFYDLEPYDGRTILVRFRFLKLSPTTARSEQAFSADGGKTWETNWINRYTRLAG